MYYKTELYATCLKHKSFYFQKYDNLTVPFYSFQVMTHLFSSFLQKLSCLLNSQVLYSCFQ